MRIDVAGSDGGTERVMDRRALLDALRPWADAQRRSAWRPVVVPGEPAQTMSKFCGTSWLVDREAHPTCKHCGRALQLFVQLDLDHLPDQLAGFFGTGVLQLFYCIGSAAMTVAGGGPAECFAEDGWAPFSDKASLVRVVPSRALRPAPPPPAAARQFRPLAITAWEPFDDHPDAGDHAMAGLESEYDFTRHSLTLRCPMVGLDAKVRTQDLAVEDIAQAALGDKLAGWPLWIQAPDYPACPTCGARMRLVFQVDSEDHVPYMFGDSGVGHITQCPTHHDVVAFGWACS
jgi:hypothetical protein